MRSFRSVVIVLGLLLSNSSAARRGEKLTKNPMPLSADEFAIYQAVLRGYGDLSTPLNVSNTTYPLASDSPMSGFANGECLKGINIANFPEISHSFHALTPDVLSGKGMRLVDPKRQGKTIRANDPSKTIRAGASVDGAVRSAFATGLFSVSEIAFDKEHRYAVVSYSLWCGSRCGRGATVVFKKSGEAWRKTDRPCGSWIS